MGFSFKKMFSSLFSSKAKQKVKSGNANRVEVAKKIEKPKDNALLLLQKENQELKRRLDNYTKELLAIEPKIQVQKDKLVQKEREVTSLKQQLAKFNRDLQQLEPRISAQKTTITDKDNELARLKQEKRTLETKLTNFNNELQALEPKIQQTQAEYKQLKDAFDEELNKRLNKLLNTPAYIPRFIHQMYKRGLADLEQRTESLHHAEILLEISQKANDAKEIQLLTKEQEIKLDIERSNHHIEKSYYNVQKMLDVLAQDREVFEHEKKCFSV